MSIVKHSNNTDVYKIKSESAPFKSPLPEVATTRNLRLEHKRSFTILVFMLRSLTHSYFTFMKHVKRGPFKFFFFLLACRKGVSGDILPTTEGKRPSRDACLLAHTCARHFIYSA